MTTTWTNTAKPSVTSWTTVTKPISGTITSMVSGGTPIGLLLALTQTTTSSVFTSAWSNVPKAIGTSWTTYPKAT